MKPQARMRRVVALAVIVVGLPHAGVAGDAPLAAQSLEALQTKWNQSMLEGRSQYFYNGRETRQDSASCRQPSGWMWVHEVASSPCGLFVADLREWRWLKSRGGWVVDGGLLGAVACLIRLWQPRHEYSLAV